MNRSDSDIRRSAFATSRARGRVERADVRVDQWKYTSCKHNIERSNGFYTFSLSDGLTEWEKEELVEKVAHYEAPEDSPLRPTADELRRSSLFPVAFSFFRLRSGRDVLCRTRAVGKDYGGSRYGNFFSHALILERGASWRDFPIDYWDSPQFADGLTEEEIDLGRTPDPLPTLDLNEVEQNRADAEKIADASSGIGAVLVDAFLKATARDRTLAVRGAVGKDAARLIKILYRFLPENEPLKRLQFATYSANPANDVAIFDRETPSILFFLGSKPAPKESQEKQDRATALFYDVLDVEKLKNRSAKDLLPYAKLLTDPDFAPFVRRFNYSFVRENADLSAAAADVAALYEIKTTRKFPDDRRLERVWAFLEKQSLSTQLATLKDLTNADYNPDDSVKLLRFCVLCDRTRLENGVAEDEGDFGKLVVNFWLRRLNESSGDDPWIVKQPEIIGRVFGKDVFGRDYCDLAVSYLTRIAGRREIKRLFAPDASDSAAGSRELFRDAVAQLIVGLGVHAAIFDYASVDVDARDAMRETFCATPFRGRKGIRAAFFPAIGKNAYHWGTHSILAPIFCDKSLEPEDLELGGGMVLPPNGKARVVSSEEPKDAEYQSLEALYLESVVNFQDSQCLAYWKEGKRWQEAKKKEDAFANLADEEAENPAANFVFVSDDQLRRERRERWIGARPNAAASVAARAEMRDLAPGAESALQYFLQEKKFKAIKEFFDGTTPRDFKCVFRYFKSRGYENLYGIEALKRRSKKEARGSSARRWIVVASIVVGVLGLGVGLFFLGNRLDWWKFPSFSEGRPAPKSSAPTR